MGLVQKFWSDEMGFVISAELVLTATVLVVGLLVGLVTIRDQVIQELADVADAVSEFDQSFSFSGLTGHSASTAGTIFNDTLDQCELILGQADQFQGVVNLGAQGVQMAVAPSTEDN